MTPLEPTPPRYNTTFLSIEELETRLAAMIDPLQIPKVLDAYEMSRSVHEFQHRNDGTPYFWHSTRVARIILDELAIGDPDIIIAALLHDVLEDSDTITRSVLEYNFGSYVAYMVETLTKDLSQAQRDPDGVDLRHAETLMAASADCLVIKLSSRLDNFRCLSFHLKRSPIVYIRNTTERYLPLCERIQHPALAYLCTEIRREANKILG